MATLHTATAADRIISKADAEQMGREIGRNVRQTVNQAMADAASRRDAEKREIVRQHHGAVTANALAGAALDDLYRQCLKPNAAQNEHTGVPDPEAYFRGM